MIQEILDSLHLKEAILKQKLRITRNIIRILGEPQTTSPKPEIILKPQSKAISSPKTIPDHNQLDLDSKKPLEMEIEDGEKFINNDSLGKRI